MSTTYRCTKLTISGLFESFYIGKNVLNELKKHKSFENEYGSIKITRDDFQNVYYISIEVKDDQSKFILPYLALLDVLSSSALSLTSNRLNENKYTYIYTNDDYLTTCFDESEVYVPTLMLKDI